MKTEVFYKIQNAYYKQVENYFNTLGEDLKIALSDFYTIKKEELKANPAEMFVEYSIKAKNELEFMFDFTPDSNKLRLSLYVHENNEKLHAKELKIIKKFKGIWDEVFENYILIDDNDLVNIISILKYIEKHYK